jgi:hypothetical protein
MAEQVGPGSSGSVVTGPASLRTGTGRDGDATPAGLGATSAAEPAPFVSQVPGMPVHFPHFNGRPVSWVAVSLMLAGFAAGALALVFHTWVVFWVGCGVTVLGALLAAATSIFDDWY